MKGLAFFSAVILIGVVVGLAVLLAQPDGSAPAPRSDEVSSGPLMVDDLCTRPERFAGEIEVLGVVGGTKPSEKLFGLIDQREVTACGTADCPEFVLPVLWDREMPAVGESVSVTGRVQQTEKGFLFVAKEVKR